MAKNDRPNVIVLITDDQGYGDLGCHGNPVARTPHLDRLHDESVRFVDFHAAPMCTPTRGQLLTGLDAARNGALNVSSGRTLLRAGLPTMADVFGDAGYSTGLFGKWHLGDNYPYRPHDRGFDEAVWFPSSHIGSVPDYWENDYFDDVYYHQGERVRHEGYCTEVFFSKAIEWMSAQIDAEEPFLTFLPTNAPHYPLYVPAEDRKAIEEAFAESGDELPELGHELKASIIRFLAMIRNLDTQVGRLRDFLSAAGIDRNTILIFMTDNGSTFGASYYNAGMRGQKAQLWEGGHRVPCFVHWPDGELGESREIGGITQVQDILPTLCELCDVPIPDAERLDGISLGGVLRRGEQVPEERMTVVNYSRMPGELDFPTPDSPTVVRQEGAGVLWKRWRFLEGEALYDLESDPLQKMDVAAEHPKIVRQMREHLERWWAEVEPFANQVQRIPIGTDEENPIMLTACEWMDVFVDQQSQVRIGQRRNSYWHVTVDRPGTYEFELRRWPRESGFALREACPAADLTDGHLDAGVSLPIARARVFLGGVKLECPIADGDEYARFEMDLAAGPMLLHTWFDDHENQPICGAYYVYARRLE